MNRFTAVLTTALVALCLAGAPKAHADLKGLADTVAGISMAPFIVSGIVIGSGALANLDSKGWRVSAYIAGSINLTGGFVLLLPTLTGSDAVGSQLAAAGFFLTGAISLGAAIAGDTMHHEPKDDVALSNFGVAPAVLSSPALGAPSPGLVFSGAF